MRKLSDALEEVIDGSPLFQLGLQEGLLNLSQLARFIHPLLTVRMKKEIQVQSITMALSRLQRSKEKGTIKNRIDLKLKNIALHSDLSILTFTKTKEVHKALQQIYSKILSANGFITITEGVTEVTIIIEERNREYAEKQVPTKPLHRRKDIASLGLRFDEAYLSMPGLFYSIFQQLYLQNLNIAELASTTTELIIYLDRKDVQLAFDTLYTRFVVDK